jgi:hypothetical protein
MTILAIMSYECARHCLFLLGIAYFCFNGRLLSSPVISYLDTNRFRPLLLAIQRTRPIPYRAKVLGRALLSARTVPNRFWMLLSGNAKLAFLSSTTTIASAANLPDTPSTTTAATSTADIAAVAASVISALTTTATGSLPTAAAATASDALAFAPVVVTATVVAAAAYVATPPAGQKRKSCHSNPNRD